MAVHSMLLPLPMLVSGLSPTGDYHKDVEQVWIFRVAIKALFAA